jgi:hypothetical protein
VRRRAWFLGQVLVGAVLVLSYGGSLQAIWWQQVPPSPVVSCEVRYVHHTYANVILGDGRLLSLNAFAIPEPGACLAPGTVVEKRRGEMRFRVNGRGRATTASDLMPDLALLGAGALLLIGGVVLWFAGRRRSE